MGQSVYINFDTENLRSARCRGITDLRNQKFTQFVVGDSIELDLYLTGSDGALNIQDYSEIRLGMGNLDARPESGSYVVGGTETLAYDHSAADLQTAVAAISSSNTTTELTGFVFKVQFDAVGAQTLPTIDNTLLQPRSTVSVTRLVTGDATTKEVWLWRLFRDPLAFTNTFTNIADNGVRATLSLATAGLYELIEQSDSVKTFFEVELTSTDGNVRTVLQASVSLNGEVIGHNFSGTVPSGGAMPAEATAFLQSFPDPEIVGDLTSGGLILPTGATDGYVLTTDANGVGTWQAVAGGGAWGDITGTLSNQTDLQAALDAKQVRTDANGAFSAGDLGGNARGANAINIQASRASATQVASGSDSVALGNNSTASGNYGATASGYGATAEGDTSTASGYYAKTTGAYSTASGAYAEATGNDATAVGRYTNATSTGATAVGINATASNIGASAVGSGATASGSNATALGKSATASGNYSTALGYFAKTTIANTNEIGYWSNGVTRGGAIRAHSTGMVALTAPTTDTAFLPSALANGSEIDGSIASGMIATRLGSTDNELITEVNRAGTIATFSAPRIDSNGAVSIGDLGGNARGTNAINIQASRALATQVASGPDSVAIGNDSTASGGYNTAIGFFSEASGGMFSATAVGSRSTASNYYASAVGNSATASGQYSSAVGYYASASGYHSNAVGSSANASGDYSTVSGYRVKTTVNNTLEIGYWSNYFTRGGAVRAHSTGMVALTAPTTDTAFLPSALANGSEIDGSIASGMIATRLGSTDNELITEVNRAGTIATFSAPRIDSNGAVSIGDLGGNARGSNAINIQATRALATQVASATNSVAIGTNSTASGYGGSTAVGWDTTASGAYGTAIGYGSTASGGYFSTAVGSYSTASGYYATASGYSVNASGDYSTALGIYAKTTVNNTAEIGYWGDSSTRGGSIRTHGTGMVAMTIQNRATAFGDGGVTAGSEADNTVIREGIALRRNGNALFIDLNIAGTVTTLSLGTAS